MSVLRQAAVVTILLLASLAIAAWISVIGQPCSNESARDALQELLPVLAVMLAFLSLVAAVVLRYACSTYLARVAVLLLFNWINVLVALVKSLTDCHLEALSTRLSPALAGIQLVLGGAIIVYFVHFAFARLLVLESAMFQPLGSRVIRRLFKSLLVCLVLFALLLSLGSWLLPIDLRRALMYTVVWYTCLALIAVLVQVLWAVALVARLAATAHRQAVKSSKMRLDSITVTAELRKSKMAAMHLLIGMSHAATTMWMNLFAAGIFNNLLWPNSGDDVPNAWALMQVFFVLDRFTNGATCCLYSGVLGGSLFASRDELDAERRRWAKRTTATKDFQPCPDAGWQAKVEELAGRGFTLRALLDFYRKLGTAEAMPHYDSSRHTTLDVVRQAIVPLSREAESSMASVMMGGKPVRPDKMITHNWGNLFRDLIACIVAEALGEDEYYMAAYWLDNDIGLVEEWLSAAGAMEDVYWVCAFSINQHAGICGGNPCGERDSVTGELHPVCGCGREKCFNSTAPLREGGQSISCEMNKFDNMLEFLGAASPLFRHVIAVDRKFTLFSRAWCIAEIAKAFDFGIEQRLMLPSAALLQDHEASLRDLRVEDMRATRPEDVEGILAKIPDKAAFNRQLQHLVHDKLLVSWKSLDEGKRLQRAGRMARWQQACQQRNAGLAPWYSCFEAADSEPALPTGCSRLPTSPRKGGLRTVQSL